MKKLHTLDQLKRVILLKKKDGKRIVLANGGFDIIHVGHIRYLKEAKKKGDLLIVALNSDSSVRKLKGYGRPILPEDERSEIISSFYFVDYIIIFDEVTVDNIILVIKPDVHAKGSDYTKESVPEKNSVLGYGGEIAITGGPKVRSTSDIIHLIANKIDNPEHF